MVNKALFFRLYLILAAHSAFGQPNWREVTTPVFERLLKEAADSIAFRRSQSDAIRSEMNMLMEKLGYERQFIVGPNDEYIEEGMHKRFSSEPALIQAMLDRDKGQVSLESTHIRLYFSDKALFRWLDIQSRLKNHPDKTKYLRWTTRYNEMPPNERPDALAHEAWEKWVENALICEIANDTDLSNPSQYKEKVGSFDPKLIETPRDGTEKRPTVNSLPIPPEELASSYPMNGQFAFHVSESIPKVGYFHFTSASSNAYGKYKYDGYELKARWMSTDKDLFYTTAEWRPFKSGAYFNLPSTLKEGQVYRLQLVAIPSDYHRPNLSLETCEMLYRGNKPKEKRSGLEAIAGEAVITEIYFRAGKYDLRERLKTMNGKVDWEHGAVVFETDEPLDPIEMNGFGTAPAMVEFELQTAHFYKVFNALHSPDVYNYLTVPTVEPLEGKPPTDLVMAELDNTLDAPFVRKVKLGSPKSYPGLTDNRVAAVSLPGKYIAPANKRYGVRDSLVTAQRIPFITKDHFTSKSAFKFAPTTCTLYVGELQQLLSSMRLQKEQLGRRMEERVNFFYELEKRRAAREGKPLAVTKEQLMAQELLNLPPDVKDLLDAKMPDCFGNLVLIYNRKFPGTEQASTSLELKIEANKK
ncbi:MAG: hypothetical protein IT258_12755 [Saprospiraceae bacterium]|nr:hypothetical protein [Saprospiraceae bacterium]